jgi:hypothetical protein
VHFSLGLGESNIGDILMADQVALETARKAKRKRKRGGKVHVGPIISDVAGRTDEHAMNVPENSYVLPADIVSGLGEGNTAAGMKVIDRMFPLKRARGGSVPIMAAGGEIVLSPEQLKERFGDDMTKAHATMDAWVKHERNKLIGTLQKLPGPAQD